MSISVIIPNYNGYKLLEKNIPKVMKVLSSYTKGKIEVIVIDDGSIDQSKDILAALQEVYKKENFTVLYNEKNMGFAKTVNKGVKKANGELLLLLNTDVCPEKDFLEPLLKHFLDEKIFAVGCLDKSIEEEHTVLRGRGVGEWTRGFFIHSRGEVDRQNTLWVSCGSGAFRKSIWDKLGGLDELYSPFYWEDIDLSYRAIKSGYKIVFEPKSVVVHEHLVGAIKSQWTESQIRRIAYRNHFIFIWKNITSVRYLISHILFLPYHIINTLLSGDKEFTTGMFLALIRFPKIMQSRKQATRKFILKDTQILPLQ